MDKKTEVPTGYYNESKDTLFRDSPDRMLRCISFAQTLCYIFGGILLFVGLLSIAFF